MNNFFESKQFKQFLFDHSLIFEDRGDLAMQVHRERPYLGQAHTLFGISGKTEVKDITLRDIADCIARGLAQSLWAGDKWDFDEHAMVQNAIVNIEKMMGIYPNIQGKKGKKQ